MPFCGAFYKTTVKKRLKDLPKAKRLYEKFREDKPKRIKKVTIDIPDTVAVMGYLSAVEYETTHNGVAQAYRHDFSPGSRPMLAAGPRKRQLFLVGGNFHVTERGIVDLTAQNKEIEDN
jgi:hypothetical protein